MRTAPSAGRLGIVLKGWPRLSETFVAQELVELERRGLAFELWSLRHPTDAKRHALHDALRARVRYLPEYLHQEPGRVLKAVLHAPRLPGIGRALRSWWRDLRRDPTPNRLRRFGQALVLAREAPGDLRFLYAHFLHTPSSVARYAGAMRGIGWGFSAHAKDIWQSPEWEKREKLGSAVFGVTCTALGAAHLRSLSPAPERLDLVYHGLDLSRFPPPPAPRRAGDGTGAPIILLSVGRLVEKKGYDLLLEALTALPGAIDWRFVHIGGGDLKQVLRDQAERLGLSDRIDWRGSGSQAEVIEALRAADLFVLPSRIAGDGDRDGLPNVLMEAASQDLPILSTSVSSIPEFIATGVDGLLVEPTAEALAAGLSRMISDPAGRAAMATAARRKLVARFGMEAGISVLQSRLETALGSR